MMAKHTKQDIIDSFIRFLNKKPIRRITVQNIVQDCGINRNTFYYYFEDIYAVLDEVFEVKKLRECEAAEDYCALSALLWRRVTFADTHRHAVANLYRDMSRQDFGQYLYGGVDTLVLSYVRREADGLSLTEAQIERTARFCKYTLMGLVLEWLDDNMEGELTYFLSSILRFSAGRVRALLEEAAAENASKMSEFPWDAAPDDAYPASFSDH